MLAPFGNSQPPRTGIYLLNPGLASRSARPATPAAPAATPQSRLQDFYAKMQAPSWYQPPQPPAASPNLVPNMPGPSPFLASTNMPIPNPMQLTPPPVAPRAPAASAPPASPFIASNTGGSGS